MNNKYFFLLIYFVLSPLILFAASSESAKQKMANDIDLIKNIFEVKYAPAEWKKNYAGWDLETEVQAVKNEILQKNSITTRDYQKILLSFFHSMQDYHVKVNFYSTEMSLLPLRLHGADGRYFVAWIAGDPSLSAHDPALAEMVTHTKAGDEVISFGGMPMDEYMQKFRSNNLGKVANGTNQMLAEQFLTFRQAAMGQDIEQGVIEIGIKHRDTGETRIYTPQWLHIPEQIQNHYPKAGFVNSIQSIALKKQKPDLFSKMMITPLYSQLEMAKSEVKKFMEEDEDDYDDDEETNFYILGQHKSFVPPLGKVLWSSASYYYHSYIFETPSGKKIGYVRIPSYAVMDDRYLEFGELMQRFQQETDALVIDQLNNPGGLLLYMLSLLSMLSNQPLELPPERMTITQQDVSDALTVQEDPEFLLKDLIEGIAGFSITPEELPDVVAYFKTIVEEWNSGHNFTKPLYLFGLSTIKPNPKTHYDKPILVLVNYLDFSCADFFPAILQDNGRAKIFGSQTAGAGGFVLSHEYPNLFGIRNFSYTGSIAYRSNNNPIENLGVTPDYPYEITAEDLTNDYKPYVKAVNETLEDMLKEAK